MKKQMKTPIFKSVLLLLSVVLLIASAIVVAVANTSATSMSKTLTVELDENVKTCTVEYTDLSGNPVTKEVSNGDVIEVLHGVKVVITVTPHNGMWPSFSFGNEEQAGSDVGNIVRWREFIADNTVSVTCENRVYTLHALNYTREDGLYEYNLASVSGGWTIADLTNGSATYQSGINPAFMFPKASMGTWEFEGWYIVTSESEGGIIPMRFDEEKQMYYIPKDMEMTTYMYEQDGVICVFPKFKAPIYEIYRQDHIYKGDATPSIPMFSYMMQAEAGTQFSAIWSNFWGDDKAAGGYVSYKGYLLMTHMCKTPCGQDVCSEYGVRDVLNNEGEGISSINTLVRYYTPITYNLTYAAVPTGYAGPNKYVYGTATESPIANPTKAGYNFLGWLVELYDPDTDTWYNPHERDANKFVGPDFALGDKNAYYDDKAGEWKDLNDIYAAKAKADGTGEIRLTAQWAPITYTIDYKWGEGVNQELADKLTDINNTLPGSFVFDSGVLEIANPTRPGYTFKKWILSDGTQEFEDANSGLTAGDGKYLLDCGKHPYNITLTAVWESEVYDVVLDSTPDVIISDVEYDSKSWIANIPSNLAAPTKEGHTFMGYYWGDSRYLYADENGNLVAEDKYWKVDGEGTTITLRAEWSINRYTVTLDSINGLPAGSSFTVKIIGIKEMSFTEFPISFEMDYNTTFRVEIKLSNNLRIAKWNGEKAEYYTGEWFVSGNITVGAKNMTLSAEARPAKPNIGVGYDVSITVKSETEIQVDFKNADVAKLYDIAISNKESEEGLEWHKVAGGEMQYVFTGLDQGTKYFVFVRFSKTETTLEGIPAYKEKTTNFINYVKDIENLLKDMITDTDGDCVKILIGKAIDEIYDLIPEDGDLPDGFKTSVDDIVAAVQAKLEFARLQDSKIAELNDFYMECILSGLFSDANKAKLLDISGVAERQIRALEPTATAEDVNNIFEPAIAAMMAIPVSYLKDGSITLSSLLGLNQGSSITLNSIQDIRALRRAIADAIAQGKITADSFITVEAATELLRTLDTISAYNFSIINVQISEGDVFTLTLTIPEAFINRTGMQVAYFNQATGMLELLETTREGNTLVFKAKYIADFVILADPVIDLTTTIIALGAILFCQLLAIVFVLAARSKAKKSVLHASVALPMFMAVHFLPIANAELIVLGLGVAVLLAQIVLMWLLLSSGMIRLFKTKRTEAAQQEVTAVVREEDLQEDPYAAFDEEPEAEEADEVVDEVLDEVVEEVLDDIAEKFIEEATEEEIEEEIEEPVEEALDEGAFDEELAEKLAYEQSEEYTDEAYTDDAYLEEAYAEDEYAEETYVNEEYVAEEYAEEAYEEETYTEEAYAEPDGAVVEEALPEETEEVYEDEEFIEQAPETNYSADEEENVYAYDEEEAERIADAPETNEEAEETAYDTDPFEGVFGETDEQGRNPADEGGDPSYEEPYGESYEFADAEDATPEDADREETEGQGAVDPTSYLVIDEEEISDDEEMYRYDE